MYETPNDPLFNECNFPYCCNMVEEGNEGHCPRCVKVNEFEARIWPMVMGNDTVAILKRWPNYWTGTRTDTKWTVEITGPEGPASSTVGVRSAAVDFANNYATNARTNACIVDTSLAARDLDREEVA